MENQPKGGFDSREASESLSLDNDVRFKGMTSFQTDNIETKELMKKIAEKYMEKREKFRIHMNDVFSKIYETEDEEEIKSLENEFHELETEWDKLFALVNRVQEHVYGGDFPKSSLN